MHIFILGPVMLGCWWVGGNHQCIPRFLDQFRGQIAPDLRGFRDEIQLKGRYSGVDQCITHDPHEDTSEKIIDDTIGPER